MNTGIYYDPLFLKHETGLHPENPDRLTWIRRRIAADGALGPVPASGLPRRDVRRIGLVHEPRYSGACAKWPSPAAARSTRKRSTPRLPTPRVRAAGAALAAVEAVLRGEMTQRLLRRPAARTSRPARRRHRLLHLQQRRHRRKYLRERSASAASQSSTGTRITATARSTSSTATARSSSRRSISGRTGPAPARARKPARAPARRIVNRRSARRHARGITSKRRAKSSNGPMWDFHPEFVLISAGFDAQREDPSRRWASNRNISGN